MRVVCVCFQEMKFSIDDLAAAPNQTSCWDGVRNYQARNMMRDKMKAGDLGFFYHSSCPEPGIVGIVKVTKESYPDHSSWNKSSGHFDPRSVPESPIWFMVDVQLVRRLSRLISLHELKGYSDELQGLRLIARGSRLSIQPVAPDHWHRILALE
uniref:Thymocyte nuclear protein 1 n=1 Tax=Spongospora subterranea TaxID=70186 RepID=A0A0H5QGJ1_9EUKA|eukprot:CRZ00717.1 hypothetical protein [Spongospora subterranea]